MFTRLWYVHQIDSMNLAYAAQIEQARADNLKGLEDATNSILLADTRYRELLADRSVLLERLRRNASAASQNGDTLGACQARASALGKMVRELSGMAEKCDSGWHECAKRKDALIEVIK
jgi:hypothetical protein